VRALAFGRAEMSIETVLMWALAFFGTGTAFALFLCGSGPDAELLGTRQNDQVTSG
jgi:hypothetical protein